ncbi:tetratricopeptide repeat protein [Salinithrix halophila]|uniref:Tetratricopeptide repeat protein n=1 Tax=Salinithrix halophila TaxID=1485204 RepID=A0ABV8JFA5_9BACL
MNREAAIFEEHGEVLAHWFSQKVKEQTLIYFDRHLDLKKISEEGLKQLEENAHDPERLAQLNRDLPFRDDDRFVYGLDSFLYAAAHLSMFYRVIWVYPEPKPVELTALARMMWSLLSLIPGHGQEVIQSFTLGAHSVRTVIAGMTLEVTTLRRLPFLDLPDFPCLDLDLDYFYQEGDRLTHRVEEVVDTLSSRGWREIDPTLTYSIASGFLPSSYRWLGNAVAEEMGCSLKSRSHRTENPPAKNSLHQLFSHGKIDQILLDKLFQEELRVLGGPGWSLRSLLAVQANDLQEAQRCYQKARENKDQASWPAYTLGLTYLKQGDYQTAADWFERSEGKRVDTIQVHSLCLRSLCESRLGHYEKSLFLAKQCISLVPMRREPYTVGLFSATQLGAKEDLEQIREYVADLKRLGFLFGEKERVV